MRRHFSAPLPLAVAALLLASTAACRDNPVGPRVRAWVTPDPLALAASARFWNIADSLSAAGAPAALVRGYRAAAYTVERDGPVTSVRVSIDGAESDWLASARQLWLPSSGGSCPAGAACTPPLIGFPSLTILIAWQRDDPRRVLQLTSINGSPYFGGSAWPFVSAPFLGPATLTLLDADGGIYEAVAGMHRLYGTDSGWPCGDPSGFALADSRPPQTSCTIGLFTAGASASLAPAPRTAVAANPASGVRTLVMGDVEVEGAIHALLACTTCWSTGYPANLLPAFNFRGSTVLPASLRVVAPSATDPYVTLTLDVHNPTPEPVTLEFTSGQQFDFEIASGTASGPLWRWSSDRMFGQAMTSRTLAPGEHWVVTERWTPTTRGPLLARAKVTSVTHFAEVVAPVTLP